MKTKLNDRFNVAQKYGFTVSPTGIYNGVWKDGTLTCNETNITFKSELLDDLLASTGWTIEEGYKELKSMCKIEYNRNE